MCFIPLRERDGAAALDCHHAVVGMASRAAAWAASSVTGRDRMVWEADVCGLLRAHPDAEVSARGRGFLTQSSSNDRKMNWPLRSI